MQITRRAVAQLLAAATAISAEAAPQDASDDPVRRARDQFEKNAQAMAALKVPMATEPAFRFRA
jgi:hypothetical protein